jgi:hypothetical protein
MVFAQNVLMKIIFKPMLSFDIFFGRDSGLSGPSPRPVRASPGCGLSPAIPRASRDMKLPAPFILYVLN